MLFSINRGKTICKKITGWLWANALHDIAFAMPPGLELFFYAYPGLRRVAPSPPGYYLSPAQARVLKFRGLRPPSLPTARVAGNLVHALAHESRRAAGYISLRALAISFIIPTSPSFISCAATQHNFTKAHALLSLTLCVNIPRAVPA